MKLLLGLVSCRFELIYLLSAFAVIGAEPSPAYFNILMHGDEPEILDGTQLAADYTFSGLQKFGQGLEERLRGLKLPSKLLEKVRENETEGQQINESDLDKYC